MKQAATLNEVLEALRGAGESTRLRILAALGQGELAVSELTQILGQSQPRISRHLKLLVEAGLIERRREGAWAFFRLARTGFAAHLLQLTLAAMPRDDSQLSRDRERLTRARERRSDLAEAYFQENAAAWDSLRALHAPEAAVEDGARRLFVPAANARFARLLDLGAGTGRMLELFADRFTEGVGYDQSQPMLALARARLEAAGVGHAELRQEDILALPESDDCADGAILHQVLHFLTEPRLALAEAARVLAPGGRLLIVDFAPHDLESLRENHAHRRLGFSREEVEETGAAVGLAPLGFESIPAPERADGEGLTVSLWLMGAA